MNQVFTVEEVEAPPMPRWEQARLIYPDVDVFTALQKLNAEETARKEHEEFWSDPCWGEDYYKGTN